jgi:hypothetical protein
VDVTCYPIKVNFFKENLFQFLRKFINCPGIINIKLNCIKNCRHFREILSGYFLFSRFDWSIFVTQLVAKHMKEIIRSNITSDMDIADYISTEFYELL